MSHRMERIRLCVVLVVLGSGQYSVCRTVDDGQPVANATIDDDFMPLNMSTEYGSRNNCSGLNILDEARQPVYSALASVRKCCPPDQSYEQVNGTKHHRCAADTTPMHVPFINATFYHECIEDEESAFTMAYRFGNECKHDSSRRNQTRLVYVESNGTLLYVIQNGSLLVINQDVDYYVFNDYCLDVDRSTGALQAIVCDPKANSRQRILRLEANLYSVCLLISVPCLLATAYLYMRVDEFQSTHGILLTCHTACLAVAFVLLIITQGRTEISLPLTYLVQYMLLSCMCWLNAMCCTIGFELWYSYIRHEGDASHTKRKQYYICAAASLGVPLIPVLLASAQDKLGIPIYYFKGVHDFDAERLGDFYFIIPAVLLLSTCIVALVAIFYIFKTLIPYPPGKSAESSELVRKKITDLERYDQLWQMAKNVSLLFASTSICMSIEMISSVTHSTAKAPVITPFAFVEILVALQGVLIFILFVCLSKPRRAVKRWWIESGSLDIRAATELEQLHRKELTN